MAIMQQLEEAVVAGALRPIDLELVRWIVSHDDQIEDSVALAVAWLCRVAGDGDSWVDIADGQGIALLASEDDGFAGLVAPEAVEPWLAKLAASKCTGDGGPLVLRGSRLTLRQVDELERQVAAQLLARTKGSSLLSAERVADALQTIGPALFPEAEPATEPDWQKLAAALACRSRLTVITGGPGTGKTYTIVRLIALLDHVIDSSGSAPLHIALAAPTGKAAARVTDSLRSGLADLKQRMTLRTELPEATTLHRLLGIHRGLDEPLRARPDKLPYDLVIVDECSMLDLAMLRRLLASIRSDARLVLLGDHQQLASVGLGNTLGDVVACGGGNRFGMRATAWLKTAGFTDLEVDSSPMSDCVVHLTRSRRFADDNDLGALVAMVRNDSADTLLTALDAFASSEVIEWCDPGKQSFDDWLQAYLDQWVAACQKSGDDVSQVLAQLRRRCILTAVREGPWGSVGINEALLQRLGRRRTPRPILITANDHRMSIYNGDLGVHWPLRHEAWFEFGAEPRMLRPATLPPHELAWAITTHKSQGSEFDHVDVVLPDRSGPILTRSLLYTAISRARTSVRIWGAEAVIRACLQGEGRKSGGLVERLQAR